jgi:hypothetical protein
MGQGDPLLDLELDMIFSFKMTAITTTVATVTQGILMRCLRGSLTILTQPRIIWQAPTISRQKKSKSSKSSSSD